MRIGTTPDQETDLTELLDINHWSEFRRVSYVTHGDQDRISDWVSLEAGKKYYIESAYLEYNWYEHFSTGVEIEQEVLNANHPRNVKEVQKLSFSTKDQRESHRLTITNPAGEFDEGTFRLQFKNPDLEAKRSSSDLSGDIKATSSENEFRDKIKPYFNSVGLNTQVTKKTYDAEDNETSHNEKDKIVKTVFDFKLDRLVSAPSTGGISMIKGSSKATFNLEVNKEVSGAPLSGQWQVKCVYPDGTFELTNPLNLDSSGHTIQRHISEHCPFMRNRILVHGYDSPFSHHNLGKQFYIDFSSYNEDPGQYEIVSYEDNPLVGVDISYTAETVVPYGKNLMFWPIPFEMLETYEEKPQMIVHVDDMPAVCHSMECSFMHVPAVGEVTSFTFTEATKTLTVTGTELPDNLSKIQSITFAGSTCTASSAAEDGALSGTEITCVLDRNPTCGSWTPAVTTFLGNVGTNAAVNDLAIPCTIASAVPDTPLNLLG